MNNQTLSPLINIDSLVGILTIEELQFLEQPSLEQEYLPILLHRVTVDVTPPRLNFYLLHDVHLSS